MLAIGVIIAFLLYAFVISVAVQDFEEKKPSEYEKILEELQEISEYLQSKHSCGLQGFNPFMGDRCLRCDEIGEY